MQYWNTPTPNLALFTLIFGRDYGSSLVRLRLAPHEITARVSLQNYYSFMIVF